MPTAIGHLHCLWYWALDYAQDGDLSGYDEIDIAGGALWEGDDREFIEALVKAGFVDIEPPRIHDWMDYAGLLIEKRKADAERKRAARERTSGGRPLDVQRTSGGRPADVQRMSSVTVPNRTVPNRTDEPEVCADAHVSETLRPAGEPAGFAGFWAAYPRKQARPKAAAAFGKHKFTPEQLREVLAALEEHKRRWDDPRFIPMAATWLNQERWKDELPEPGTVIPIQAARGSSRRAETEEALEAFLRIANGEDA